MKLLGVFSMRRVRSNPAACANDLQVLKELRAKAYSIELDRDLTTLASSVDAWRDKRIDDHQLSDAIHEFHDVSASTPTESGPLKNDMLSAGPRSVSYCHNQQRGHNAHEGKSTVFESGFVSTANNSNLVSMSAT